MENRIEQKWNEKPLNIIILLVVFFPAGLYFMWKNKAWNKGTRWIISSFFIFFMLISLGTGNSSTYSNGIGTIKHYTADDFNKDEMLKKMGEEVWKFSKDHPNAKELNLIIIVECKDKLGNESKYESKITFNSNKIQEFSKYNDANSFNANCDGFGVEMLKWYPCGVSPF